MGSNKSVTVSHSKQKIFAKNFNSGKSIGGGGSVILRQFESKPCIEDAENVCYYLPVYFWVLKVVIDPGCQLWSGFEKGLFREALCRVSIRLSSEKPTLHMLWFAFQVGALANPGDESWSPLWKPRLAHTTTVSTPFFTSADLCVSLDSTINSRRFRC